MAKKGKGKRKAENADKARGSTQMPSDEEMSDAETAAENRGVTLYSLRTGARSIPKGVTAVSDAPAQHEGKYVMIDGVKHFGIVSVGADQKPSKLNAAMLESLEGRRGMVRAGA